MRVRALITAAIAVVATLALSGCFTIRTASMSQVDVIGPVEIKTELCLRSAQPAEPAPGLSCRSETAEATSPDETGEDLQLFYAYLVDENVGAPDSFTGSGALAGVTFTQHPDFAARLAERPGQAPRFAMKWVAYGSTRVPKIANVTTPQNATIAPRFRPDPASGIFNARIVHGWRYVRDEAGYELTRPVVCGDTNDGTVEPATDCGDDSTVPRSGPIESNYFPRKNGGADNNQFTYPLMNILTAAATINAPLLGGAIDSGQATSLRFGVTSRTGPGLPPSIPVTATTTIPGGSVTLDRTTLPLGAGVDVITAEVAAPAGAPSGIFDVTVALGEGAGRTTASTAVGVTAVGQNQNPQFGSSGLLTGKQTAALMRELLRKASAGKALRTKGKVTVRFASQAGVKVKLVLRASGKKGKTIAQGTSKPSTGGRDQIVLTRTAAGKKALRAGRTWKGRMVITLTGAQADNVNESLSLKVPRR